MASQNIKIDFDSTNQFSKIFIDYVNNENALRPFYSYIPTIDSFNNVIEDKKKETINRKLLVEILKNQYENSQIKIEQSTINNLLNENTFTVCTGHQLCLFTGPLYFIYKIITTINLAEELKKKYTEYNFVPVYWMASEDHDFEEISSINLFGKKIKWNNEEAKGAVGKLNTHSVHPLIDELKQILGESENSKKLIQLFSDAYLNHSNLANATRYFTHQLFGTYGLLVIDADDTQLKNSFSSIIKDDIFNNTNHKLVDATINQLKQIGYDSQVNPREINCFYLKDNVRERIENDGNIFQVLNTDIRFTKEELITEIDLHSDRFSPNVVLRPLYQQFILPNLAYVGGPGELAYWLEYKTMFEHHKINFPVLIPRNFALLTDEKTNQQIEKLGFTINDFFRNSETLIKEFVTENASEEISLKPEETKLILTFNEIVDKAIKFDATLKSSVEAEKQKALNSLKNIESKLLKAEKQKQETSINQIKKIKAKFFPEDILQERYDNFAPFYLKSGEQFVGILKQQFNPFDFKFLIIELNGNETNK